jgi:hypothetical protein
MTNKTKLYALRMTAAQLRALETIAEQDDLRPSEVVRALIEREAKRRKIPTRLVSEAETRTPPPGVSASP